MREIAAMIRLEDEELEVLADQAGIDVENLSDDGIRDLVQQIVGTYISNAGKTESSVEVT